MSENKSVRAIAGLREGRTLELRHGRLPGSYGSLVARATLYVSPPPPPEREAGWESAAFRSNPSLPGSPQVLMQQTEVLHFRRDRHPDKKTFHIVLVAPFRDSAEVQSPAQSCRP